MLRLTDKFNQTINERNSQNLKSLLGLIAKTREMISAIDASSHWVKCIFVESEYSLLITLASILLIETSGSLMFL